MFYDSTSNALEGALFVTATGGTPCSGAIVLYKL